MSGLYVEVLTARELIHELTRMDVDLDQPLGTYVWNPYAKEAQYCTLEGIRTYIGPDGELRHELRFESP